MLYHIDDDRYRCTAMGTPEEIRSLLRAFCTRFKVRDETIEDILARQPTSMDMLQQNLSTYHRIYFNRQEFLYLPNVSASARAHHYPYGRQRFTEALADIGVEQIE